MNKLCEVKMHRLLGSLKFDIQREIHAIGFKMDDPD